MRKHRLAERLLADVIGLDVGGRARRGLPLGARDERGGGAAAAGAADHPTESPYGNPIPGLDELDASVGEQEAFLDGDVANLRDVVERGARSGMAQNLVVRRLGEPLQSDTQLMQRLRRAGVQPGQTVRATVSPGGVLLGSVGETAELDLELAGHVFVTVRAT